MSEEKNSGLDPRFDPAFQRGFDQSDPDRALCSGLGSQEERPEVTLPVVPAARADEKAPAEDPRGEVADATPVSLDPAESPTQSVVQDVSPTRNPFLLVLLIVAVVLIVAGVILFVQTGDAFNSSEVQSQGDYMSLNATIETAPFISLLGGATLIGVLFVFAVRYVAGRSTRAQVRALTRQTSLRPDQSASIAATFVSTSDRASAASRTTPSVMSLSWPAARLGQATHSAPAGKIALPPAAASSGAISAAVRAKASTTSAARPDGHLVRGIRCHLEAPPRRRAFDPPAQPWHQPSFFNCGVPE